MPSDVPENTRFQISLSKSDERLVRRLKHFFEKKQDRTLSSAEVIRIALNKTLEMENA